MAYNNLDNPSFIKCSCARWEQSKQSLYPERRTTNRKRNGLHDTGNTLISGTAQWRFPCSQGRRDQRARWRHAANRRMQISNVQTLTLAILIHVRCFYFRFGGLTLSITTVPIKHGDPEQVGITGISNLAHDVPDIKHLRFQCRHISGFI